MIRIGRRRFVLAAGALLTLRPALAQYSSRVYSVGVLFGGAEVSMATYRAALVERLATHGFVERRNLRIEARTSHFGYSTTARELVALKPDAILACATIGTLDAKAAAGTIPIVFAWVADPVAEKFVQSYAQPGGNITGVTNRFGELLIKRLELARELFPAARRLAVTNVNSPIYARLGPPVRSAANKFGFELIEVPVYDWGASVGQAKAAGAAAVIPIVGFTALGLRSSGEAVVKAALEHRVPVIFAGAEMVDAGGLVSYGTNLVDDIRRAADILARVLKGADPATIPVDQAARFELVINMKTAKAIGLTIPPSILLRADRVIE